MARGYADHGVLGCVADCVTNRRTVNSLSEVLRNRRIEAPLLDPVLCKVDLWYCNGAAAVRAVYECHDAGFATTNRYRRSSIRDDPDIQHHTGKVMEPCGKQVRMASA